MDSTALGSYSSSPLAMLILLVVSLLLGAALLVWVVRWTEGFAISFWASLKMTALGIVVALVCQVAVFAAMLQFGDANMAAYWYGLFISTVLALLVYTVVYAYGVKKPTGERIGIAQAIKVTLVQLALSIAAIVVIAIVVAALVASGVVSLPEVNPELLPL